MLLQAPLKTVQKLLVNLSPRYLMSVFILSFEIHSFTQFSFCFWVLVFIQHDLILYWGLGLKLAP